LIEVHWTTPGSPYLYLLLVHFFREPLIITPSKSGCGSTHVRRNSVMPASVGVCTVLSASNIEVCAHGQQPSPSHTITSLPLPPPQPMPTAVRASILCTVQHRIINPTIAGGTVRVAGGKPNKRVSPSRIGAATGLC
jgi:hypothetical protein